MRLFSNGISFWGFHISFDEGGPRISWGVPGFKVSSGPSGQVKSTFFVPGTGLSYSDSLGKIPAGREELKASLTEGRLLEAAAGKKSVSKSGRVKIAAGNILMVVCTVLGFFFPLFFIGTAIGIYLKRSGNKDR